MISNTSIPKVKQIGYFSFYHDLILLGNTTIASNGGAVGVVGTIDSNAAGTKTLTINSGAGNVDVSGKIGATRAVGNTSINASSGAGTIDLFDIGDGTPAAGIDGTLTVGNTLTNQVEFDGVNYDISGNVLIKSICIKFIYGW